MADREIERMIIELAEQMRSRFYGKYRGLVDDVDDSENLGRIVAKVPEVYGDQKSPWALPCVPFAGDGYGVLALPKVGDGVWIEFEGGDPSRPIWSGCWWGSDEVPDDAGADTRVWVTPGGHKLILDDDQNQIQLVHASGPEITITDSDITLKVGETELVVSNTGLDVNDGAFSVN